MDNHMQSFCKYIAIICFCLIGQGVFAQTNQKQVQQLSQQISLEIEEIDAALPQINILMKKGEKAKAKTMVKKALKQIEKIEAEYKQLAQLDEIAAKEIQPLSQILETKRYLIVKASTLRYTSVYIICEAKLFDTDYSTILNEIQSSLSDNNVSFVDGDSISDWVVKISAKAREYNKADFGGMSNYFSYVDAKTIIEKTSSGKRIVEKTFSEKGGSPISFEQAAQEAYKKLSPQISATIKEYILL